jgi:hypothetical protein
VDLKEVDLSSIYGEPSLIAWKVEASIGNASLKKATKNGSYLSPAFRVDLGPTVTRHIAIFAEVGVRTTKNASYLELAVAPMFEVIPFIGGLLYFTPAIGTAVASYEDGVCKSSTDKCATKFQILASGEIGLWFKIDEMNEPNYTVKIINRIKDIKDAIQNQCADAKADKQESCKHLVAEINVYRARLREKGMASRCDLDSELKFGDSESMLRFFSQVDVCHFYANERRKSTANAVKMGIIIGRFEYIGGRDLPQLFVFDAGLGLMF